MRTRIPRFAALLGTPIRAVGFIFDAGRRMRGQAGVAVRAAEVSFLRAMAADALDVWARFVARDARFLWALTVNGLKLLDLLLFGLGPSFFSLICGVLHHPTCFDEEATTLLRRRFSDVWFALPCGR